MCHGSDLVSLHLHFSLKLATFEMSRLMTA